MRKIFPLKHVLSLCYLKLPNYFKYINSFNILNGEKPFPLFSYFSLHKTSTSINMLQIPSTHKLNSMKPIIFNNCTLFSDFQHQLFSNAYLSTLLRYQTDSKHVFSYSTYVPLYTPQNTGKKNRDYRTWEFNFMYLMHITTI